MLKIQQQIIIIDFQDKSSPHLPHTHKKYIIVFTPHKKKVLQKSTAILLYKVREKKEFWMFNKNLFISHFLSDIRYIHSWFKIIPFQKLSTLKNLFWYFLKLLKFLFIAVSKWKKNSVILFSEKCNCDKSDTRCLPGLMLKVSQKS